MNNYAYIDNQNLYLATKNAPEPWTVDMLRFRVYLREKYKVERAYLFMGVYDKKYGARYKFYTECGYELMFRAHVPSTGSPKKGNVDTDVIFQMMHDYHHNLFDKCLLVTGDGDYFKTVDYLLKQNRFECLILPSHKNASSLYKKITHDYYIYLDDASYKKKLEYDKREI